MALLRTECLSPQNSHSDILNHQSACISRWGLWEVMRSSGWDHPEWHEHLYKKSLESLCCLISVWEGTAGQRPPANLVGPAKPRPVRVSQVRGPSGFKEERRAGCRTVQKAHSAIGKMFISEGSWETWIEWGHKESDTTDWLSLSLRFLVFCQMLDKYTNEDKGTSSYSKYY